MLPTLFTYFYEISQIHPKIQDIAHKIYHHQNNTKAEQLKYLLYFIIYDDSITITIRTLMNHVPLWLIILMIILQFSKIFI